MPAEAELGNTAPTASDNYVCLGRSRTSSDFWSSPRDITALILLLLPLVVLAATQVDGTFAMQGGGKGFKQHYGFWIIFVTTPGLVLLAGALLDRCTEILSNPGQYLSEGANPGQREQFRLLVERHLESLSLKTRHRYVLQFGILVGLSYFIINVIKTWDPYGTYGHDVFDAWNHEIGYLVTKLYLLPVVLLVYPIVIYIAAHVTWSMVIVLRYLCDNDVLEISYFHEDNCGGTSCFGELNLYVIAIYTLGMFLTHERTYFVTSSALIFCSAATTAQSIAAVWAIHSFVRTRKRMLMREITKRLDSNLKSSIDKSETFRGELLAVRNHVQSIKTFPYAANVALIVNAIRFAPVVIAIVTFVKR